MMPDRQQYENDEHQLEVGQFKVGPRGVQMLLQALSRGTPTDRLRTALREGFQNAIDASTSNASPGSKAVISIDVEGEDVVLRDHGIGLTPHQINDLLLSLFATGKEEGLGGFGVGAGSVILGAPDVVIRTRKAGSPPGIDGRGAEFRRSWAGERAPSLMTVEAGQAFGEGTEIRFAGVLSDSYDANKVTRGSFDRIVTELFATSQLPANIELRVNGEPVRPLIKIGPETRKMDSEIEEAFPGALVEHHIVPLPEKEERHPHLSSPKSIIQLEDPRGSGWAISQWDEYLDDDVGFYHIVRIRPTVRPDEEGYPFNYERTTIADEAIRNAVAQTRRRFVVDRQTALKQQQWKHTYYTKGEQADPATNPSAALAEEVSTGTARDRLKRLMTALDKLPEGEVVEHLQRRAEQIGRSRGTAVTVEELIAEQDTLVKRDNAWEAPDFLPARFDPDNPKSIRSLAPILSAMRIIGMAIREEAAAIEPHVYGTTPPPYYGFLFSNTERGMLTKEEDAPMGNSARFLLINPSDPRFRTARTPEALCDMLVNLLVHEHTHESASWHSEAFSTLCEAIHDRVANIKPEIHKVFKDTGAWKAFRKLQGLPLRPSKKEERPQELRPISWDEAREIENSVQSEEDWRVARLVEEVARYARYDYGDYNDAAEAISEILGTLQATRTLNDDSLARVQRVAKGIGVRKIHAPTIRAGANRPDHTVELQLDLIEAYSSTLSLRSMALQLGAEGDERDHLIEFFRTAGISPAHLLSYMTWSVEAQYGTSPYHRLHDAIVWVERDGITIRDALERARGAAKEDEDDVKATLRSPDAEFVVALAALARFRHEPENMPEDALPIARTLMSSGKLPRKPRTQSF